jgi:hypothetical protein
MAWGDVSAFAIMSAPVLFREAVTTKAAAGPDRPQLHQSALPTYGGLYAWEFEKGGRELRVRVEGQLVLNGITLERLERSCSDYCLLPNAYCLFGCRTSRF